MKKNKIHWIRKYMACDPIFNHYYGYKKNTVKAVYDYFAVCGKEAVLNGTCIRKNVTCKKCLNIMEKKGMLP